MVRELDFSDGSVADLKEGLKEIFRDDLWDRSQVVVKRFLEEAIALEFEEYIEVKRYERNDARKDQRNGYRTRSLLTASAVLQGIRVPRCRREGFQPRSFERHKRVQRRVDDVVVEMFLRGISTRKVGDVLEALCGCRLSASYVSKVSKRVEGEVKAFSHRPLDDHLRYLFLDGVVLRVKEVSHAVKMTALVAYGIRWDGTRELIDFRVGKREGKGAWTCFLQSLYDRGLRGDKLDLIITDGCPGLWAATQEVYPLVEHSRRRRDWVHKLRNVANNCPKKYLNDCVAHARKIYLSPTVKIALRVFREWERTWRDKAPKAVRCLARDIDNLLVFLKCPVEHHRIIRTTNVMAPKAPLFRELKRRVRVMGTFPDMGSCRRMIYAFFTYHNRRWARSSYRIKEIALNQKQVA